MASDLFVFGKGVDLAIESLVSPEERRVLIREAADALLADAEAEMRAAGRAPPRHVTLVDGREVQDLSRIDPDEGTITFRFDGAGGDLVEVVQAVLDLIRSNSPVLTGAYRASHRVFADDKDVTDAMPIPPEQAEKVDRWKIQPIIIYGRKLEEDRKRRGSEGVYEAVAALAGHRFGNQADVGYGFESPLLPYVAGGANRAERQAIRAQPNRIRAMRAERATRLPCITITAKGR